MNGKNLNVQYRRNSYAKKRIKVISILAAIVFVVLIVLFFVLGRFLKAKTDNDKNEDKGSAPAVDTQAPEHADIPSVNGYGFSISGATNVSVSDRVALIAQEKGNAINFVARNSSGAEIYFSEVAQNMGKQSSSSGYIGVDAIASRAENRSLRTSAILPINAFEEKNDLERSVLLAYDAAICAELFREGADDVLVTLNGSDVTEENIEELIRLAESVKHVDAEAVIGIALGREMLEAEESEVLVAKLWEAYDFLAYDISVAGENAEPREFAEENVNAEVHYYLLRYKMRVLLPAYEGEDLEAAVSVLKGKGLSNWQTVMS